VEEEEKMRFCDVGRSRCWCWLGCLGAWAKAVKPGRASLPVCLVLAAPSDTATNLSSVASSGTAAIIGGGPLKLGP
jgi:hypothetical protein